ncbi:MAG: sugar phosphate nucleotidyltransferase [Verrucomicrobiae bacterium]
MKAFVLGAGLGTRLRPLTERRPKPLVPICGKPLITFAFDHLIASGAASFAVNTHHCPDAYASLSGGGAYRGRPLAFLHEPVLLDTGGGIKNAAGLLGDGPFLVYNGDVIADFPLRPAIERHLASGNIATLILRSSGGPLHVQCRDGRVSDIRNTLGDSADPSFLFTGISLLSPEIFRHIPAGGTVSIIPVYLSLIRAGVAIGGVVEDGGLWFDIGSRDAYLGAHALFQQGGHHMSYIPDGWARAIQEPAEVAPSARLEGVCSIGRGSRVGAGAVLEDCVLWENATVLPGARLSRCVVRDGMVAGGTALGVDF